MVGKKNRDKLGQHISSNSLWFLEERGLPFNNLLGFSLFVELVRIIKMRSNETYNEVQIARHLFALFFFKMA